MFSEFEDRVEGRKAGREVYIKGVEGGTIALYQSNGLRLLFERLPKNLVENT